MAKWTDYLKLTNSVYEEESKKIHRYSFIISVIITLIVLILTLIYVFSVN